MHLSVSKITKYLESSSRCFLHIARGYDLYRPTLRAEKLFAGRSGSLELRISRGDVCRLIIMRCLFIELVAIRRPLMMDVERRRRVVAAATTSGVEI